MAIDTTDAAWLEIINTINPIRNYITHDDGYLPSEEEVKKAKAEKEKVNKDSNKEERELKIREFIASNPSIIILTQFDKIQIKKEFIIRFSKTVDAFFTNIFSAWETWCTKKQGETPSTPCE